MSPGPPTHAQSHPMQSHRRPVLHGCEANLGAPELLIGVYLAARRASAALGPWKHSARRCRNPCVATLSTSRGRFARRWLSFAGLRSKSAHLLANRWSRRPFIGKRPSSSRIIHADNDTRCLPGAQWPRGEPSFRVASRTIITLVGDRDTRRVGALRRARCESAVSCHAKPRRCCGTSKRRKLRCHALAILALAEPAAKAHAVFMYVAAKKRAKLPKEVVQNSRRVYGRLYSGVDCMPTLAPFCTALGQEGFS